MKRKHLHIELDENLDLRLRTLCTSHGDRTKMVRRFIEEGIKREEDYLQSIQEVLANDDKHNDSAFLKDLQQIVRQMSDRKSKASLANSTETSKPDADR